jgi:hypothetical protein
MKLESEEFITHAVQYLLEQLIICIYNTINL